MSQKNFIFMGILLTKNFLFQILSPAATSVTLLVVNTDTTKDMR